MGEMSHGYHRGIPAGQLTGHVSGKRKRLPITTTITREVVLNNPLGLFLPPFWRGLLAT